MPMRPHLYSIICPPRDALIIFIRIKALSDFYHLGLCFNPILYEFLHQLHLPSFFCIPKNLFFFSSQPPLKPQRASSELCFSNACLRVRPQNCILCSSSRAKVSPYSCFENSLNKILPKHSSRFVNLRDSKVPSIKI